MKKKPIPVVLFAAIIMLSIGSFIYLNTTPTSVEQCSYEKAQLEEEEDDQPEKEVMLPDVELVKKIIQIGKNILPAS